MADSISRPGRQICNIVKVLATSTTDKLTAKLSNSNLDPYENSALRYYLEFGRHEPGTSSKTCAAVKRQALGYRFDLDYIYHLEDNGD